MSTNPEIICDMLRKLAKPSADLSSYATEDAVETLLENWKAAMRDGVGLQGLVTDIDGVNKPANVVGSEMLRLNTAIAPTPGTAQSRLGVLGGDNAGFPNGRRPGDDVVDIELRVAMGVLCTLNIGGCTPANAPAGALRYTDGAWITSAFFASEFPYLRAALPGSPNPDNAIKAAKRQK